MRRERPITRELLERWFDLSVHYPDQGNRNRAEILIKFTMLAGAWGLAFAAGFYYLGNPMGVTVLVLDIVLVTGLLLWVKHTKAITAAGHFLCATLFGLVLAFSAGHISYPISGFLWLMLAPILAFMICSKRSALIWSGIVTLTYLFWFVLSVRGIRFTEPLVLPLDQMYIDFISISGFFLVLLPLVSLYHHNLHDSLDLMNRANEQFAAARQEAELASAAKTDFLASMSHEMRTPLNAIIGFSDLMKDSGLNEEQTELNQTVRRASLSLLHLIEELLDVGAIESRKIKIESQDFDLRTWISETMDTLRPMVSAKDLTLEYQIADDVPEVLHSDPARLSQILLNLANNAVRYTREGKITVDVRMEHHDDGSDALEFAVSDTGVGISLTDQRKIFEPFYQVKEDGITSPGGAGLGLSISNRLVKLLGGTLIEVTSSPGDGSSFSFCLPLVRGRRPYSVEIDSQVEALIPLPGHCPRILVVDDVAENRKLVGSILDAAFDAKIDHACGGAEAWKKAQANDYDLIVLDIILPDKTGYEVLEKLKSLPERPPVFAYSAAVSRNDREKARMAGFDAFIDKPIVARHFVELVARWLSRDSHDGQAEATETEAVAQAGEPS